MYDRFLRHPFMSPTGVAACDAAAFIEAMCTFELALAHVEETFGHLPAGTSDELARHIRPTHFDTEALAANAADGGNVAIPFVKQAKALLPESLQASFHKGATSQDVIDSALMLLIKPRLARCLTLVDTAIEGGTALMRQHRETPMIGRTLTQQALPITFGAKVGQWLTGLAAAERRLRDAHDQGLFVQFGGPVGTHHGLDDGLELMDALAERLGLNRPLLPWHTDRQPILALIDAIGAVAVAAEKIATDIAFMAQTEVGEAREPAATGAGGSSSMPHKANPVGSARIRAAARQIHAAVGTLHGAGAQAHERAFGEWHAEWAPLVDAVLLLEGALETLAPLLGELQIDREAMRANLALAHGANLAAPTIALLQEAMSTDRAKALAAQAAETARRERCSYADALLTLPVVAEAFDPERVRSTVDPAAYVGTSAAQVDRVANRLCQR
ncbi:adenylosuccinate lyase family protein [Salinisphaera hydrothermalis]|uniref:3-carboxy-cis,cis-muconate cycloisomerase n=1 Tax=Salinisphaera hydrothermalis (strain C41B8) TaxID=1304275 RepID=A0A084IPH8_SALHC|nr:adenylosuccinate lyase family protein [Salinisphaera hydrothermalis]KEZ78612.1 3-carboxy-cis,cis-muconate cycloisomerase [Salinisphaera hydrothermalis C41B8]